MQVIRTTLLGFIGVVAVSLAACGGSSIVPGATAPPTPNPNSTGTAVVRFVAGSPDIGTTTAPGNFDVYVDGVLLLSQLPYSAVTPYYLISGGVTHKIEFDTPGTTTAIVPAVTTPVLSGANKQITVVLAGTAAKNNVQMQLFSEPAYTSTTLQGAVNFHHSAPSYASNIDWGTYSPGSMNYSVSSTVTFARGAAPVPQPIPSLVPAAAATAPGIGFYVIANGQRASSTTAPAAKLEPVTIDPANTADLFPFPGDYHLSIFAIDPKGATTVVQLVARFD